MKDLVKYQEYEFCKALKCKAFKKKCSICGCLFTAKEYHSWLKKNNFEIIKKLPINALA